MSYIFGSTVQQTNTARLPVFFEKNLKKESTS